MALFDEYRSHDAVALAARVEKGDVSPGELLEAALSRADAVEPQIRSIVTPMFDSARKEAAGALPDGPLRGVPYLLKDLHAMFAGVRTTNGSRLFEDFVPDHDSELVIRYRQAGLVVFGKSASPEYGITTSTESALFGATRNPWNLERTAGGSSGGAAAAVAAGILPAAHASDGGGSIRIPASCCGLFGLKPTRARTPAGPDVGEGWSGMSSNHAVTRSVRDSAVLLDATHGADVGAPYWAPPPERPFAEEVGRSPGRLRIALQTETFNGSATHPDCVAAAEDVAKLLVSLGHEVVPVTLELDQERFVRSTQVIIASNLRATVHDRAQALGRELAPDDLEPGTHAMVGLAASAGADDYARAVQGIHAAGRAVGRFFEEYDALLTPTLAAPPFELGRLALTNDDLPKYIEAVSQTIGYTSLFNASGNPAASLPLCWNGEGMPIGVQLVGRFGDEATLLRLAAQLEQERPWFDRLPPLA
jgi:Asp-tRNA(Asn)/Glu-tRNA(Gln) amidotransferase A subunit family amidase